jgi:Na+/proline symporter
MTNQNGIANLPAWLFPALLLGYFLLLNLIGFWVGKKGDNRTFFTGNRNSPWMLVAFGMIGASLSGVTFLSIPGAVWKNQLSYMQIVLGYFVGYMVIVYVLLPLYYKLKLPTIYSYLLQRFGVYSYKIGAFYFILSRTLGSALRLFLAAVVLQTFISENLGIPFEITVFLTILLVWLYSFKGGIKTIVYTDTFQTFFMLLSLVLTCVFLWNHLAPSSPDGVWSRAIQSPFSQWFVWDTSAKNYFWKDFIGGMFITIVMTGLDQDMMQKNLTCRNLPESQKNVRTMSLLLLPVNFLFLFLGILLYLYGMGEGILEATTENKILFTTPEKEQILLANTDAVFPMIAANYLPAGIAIVFFLGLVAAAYSSADSALTALTTSFCVDFLGFNEEKGSATTRKWVHIGFASLLFVVILIFKYNNSDAVITELLKLAAFTYGPLLGMFGFGMLSKRKVRDKWVPLICILSPILCYVIDKNSVAWLNGYKFGIELLLLNGTLTAIGLGIFSQKEKETATTIFK